jgi:hypothetical protein
MRKDAARRLPGKEVRSYPLRRRADPSALRGAHNSPYCAGGFPPSTGGCASRSTVSAAHLRLGSSPVTTPNVPTDRADGGAVLPSWLSTRAWPGGLLEIAELPERDVTPRRLVALMGCFAKGSGSGSDGRYRGQRAEPRGSGASMGMLHPVTYGGHRQSRGRSVGGWPPLTSEAATPVPRS